jgi:hypothetical protein
LLRLGWLLLDGGVILGSNYVIFQQLGANAPKGMLFFLLRAITLAFGSHVVMGFGFWRDLFPPVKYKSSQSFL